MQWSIKRHKDKMTSTDPQNTTQTTKDSATWIHKTLHRQLKIVQHESTKHYTDN
jgi:hypothetical protein